MLSNITNTIYKFISNVYNLIVYKECPWCHKRGLYFSHEESFWPGCPDIYRCKYCNEELWQ